MACQAIDSDEKKFCTPQNAEKYLFCLTASELDKRCQSEQKNREIRLGFRVACMNYNSMRSTFLDPNRALAGTLKTNYDNAVALARHKMVRAGCAKDIPKPPSGLRMACSPRTSVSAAGGNAGVREPSCGTPGIQHTADKGLSVINSIVTATTPPPLSFIFAIGSLVVEDLYWKHVGPHGKAGCQQTCAILPADADIKAIKAYAADFVSGPMQGLSPGPWDHWPGHVRFDPEHGISRNDKATVVCGQFRNWLGSSVRDFQLVVHY